MITMIQQGGGPHLDDPKGGFDATTIANMRCDECE